MADKPVAFSTLKNCVQCSITEGELAKKGKTLQMCSRCRIAKYCSKECQRQNLQEHQDLCKKLKKVPVVQEDMLYRLAEGTEKRNSFFPDCLKNFICTVQVLWQCKSVKDIDRIYKSVERFTCFTWKSSYPCFRFFLPPLLFIMDREEDAFNLIYYLILEYGKDQGRSLPVKMNDKNILQYVKKRDKYLDIYELMIEDGYKSFGTTNNSEYCGALLVTLIGIKWNILKDLDERIKQGDMGLKDMKRAQEKQFTNLFCHLIMEYDNFVQFLVFGTPIKVNVIARPDDKQFLEERVNAFTATARLKIAKTKEDAEKLIEYYKYFCIVSDALKKRDNIL